MNIRPSVSIGMPVFNGEKYLKRAINSLLNQSYKNFELIISDNASTDNTWTIVSQYAKKDLRIRLFRQKENIGINPNFMFVLQRAKGRYFFWAACDDQWEPSFISRLKSALDENSQFGVAMSSIERVYENGLLFDYILLKSNNDLTKCDYEEVFKKMIKIKHNQYIHNYFYALYRTDLLKSFLDQPFPDCLAGDRVFMCEIALSIRFYSIPDILFRKTISKKSIKLKYENESIGKRWEEKGKYSRYYFYIFKRVIFSQYIPFKRKVEASIIWMGMLALNRRIIKEELRSFRRGYYKIYIFLLLLLSFCVTKKFINNLIREREESQKLKCQVNFHV